MANDIRGLMAPKVSRHLPYNCGKSPPRKTDQTAYQTRARQMRDVTPRTQRWSTCTGRLSIQNNHVQLIQT